MGSGVERVQEKIKLFKRKYYLNIFIRGLILSLTILCSYFLIAAILEHNLWLGAWARFLAFFTFFAIVLFCIYKFLKYPLQWWLIKRGITEEESARIIGNYVPTVKDRLLNFIQLTALKNSSLAYASIQQKSQEFEPIEFEGFIDIGENKRYLKFLALPVIVLFAIFIFNRNIIIQSTERIVHFNRQYSPTAPFQFIFDQPSTAFYNEDFPVKLKLQGNALPQQAYLIAGNQRLKLNQSTEGEFVYTFEKIQREMNIQFEAAGFYSDSYPIELANRPELTQLKVELEYPRYIQKKNDQLINAGNLEIPEGTIVRWKLSTSHTEKASIFFSAEGLENKFQQSDKEHFSFGKEFRNNDLYEIHLENRKSKNKERITYNVQVIKDQFPSIAVNNFKDSVLYKRVMLGGIIGDDYGVTALTLNFKVKDEKQKELLSRTVSIPFDKNQIQQSFFYNWSLDSLRLKPGQYLEYYLQVWDNDGVNGRKSTRTANYTFFVPSEDNLVTDITRSQNQTEQKISESVGKANKLQDQIERAYQKLKGKQNLDWQDKKMLEDIVQQKQSLDKMLEQLRDQNKLLDQKKDAFTEQNERIREKAEQIQKLMDELLDEETKRLFAELQKLLKENADLNQIQKLLNKLNQNTNNLEKELERTLQLFKEIQFEYKLDQAVQQLKKQIEEQKALLEKTERLENESKKSKNDSKGEQKEQKKEKNDQAQNSGEENPDNESLADDQEKLMEDFKKTSEQIEEIKKLGEELNKNDENLPSEEDSKEILDQQEQSKDMLKQNQPAKSKPPQQKSLQKMQKMQQQMEGAQNSMMMEMDMQNLESMRQIIHGLVKLSFDQENLMKQFGELSQNDPRFNSIAQRQLKLKDDAKVLEDSLLALGKRDPFMGSIVTKEVTELNNHLDKIIEANKERRKPQASSEMQASMASINNLALMLDSHFDMMMQMMANAQPSMKKSKQQGQRPNLSQMQQQLNQKIEELKGSGKSGRELSEELAEMAAEQERIRRALQEMQEKMKDGKLPGSDQIPSKMEQTEMDLVNKQLTDQLIKRQREILTRLLETEKSMREQDLDEERKGESAKDYEKEIPRVFEEYLRLKEKEVELLKTVPPKLYPYYKKEVSEYFKRMGNQ